MNETFDSNDSPESWRTSKKVTDLSSEYGDGDAKNDGYCAFVPDSGTKDIQEENKIIFPEIDVPKIPPVPFTSDVLFQKELQMSDRYDEKLSASLSEEDALHDNNDDFCFLCRDGGELICCDSCEKSYHLYCHVPPMLEPPRGKFLCMECTAPSRKKRSRCGRCNGCLKSDCGFCVACLDKPKFGGPGKRKMKCVERKCINMSYAQMVPATLTRPVSSIIPRTKKERKLQLMCPNSNEKNAIVSNYSKNVNGLKKELDHDVCENSIDKNSNSSEKKQNRTKRQKIKEPNSVQKSKDIDVQKANVAKAGNRKRKSPEKSDPNSSSSKIAKFTIVDLANWHVGHYINGKQFQELCPLASSNKITEDELENIEFTKIDVMNWFKNGIIESTAMQILYEHAS